jgi:hypothetical protein
MVEVPVAEVDEVAAVAGSNNISPDRKKLKVQHCQITEMVRHK